MSNRRAGGTVGELVLAYLSAQTADIAAGAPGLREGQNAIHPTRVAIRRWRASLRTFTHVFDAERAASLDESLAWYGRLLGAARDYEVLQQYLSGVIADLQPALVVGPVARDIEAHLHEEYERHRDVLLRAIETDRYTALIEDVTRWVGDPPTTDEAERSEDHLIAPVERVEHKLAKRLMKAVDQDEDVLLHRARKSAKRARYAVELAAPVLGSKAMRKKVKRYTRLQDVLGAHQDSVVTADALLDLRDLASAAGRDGFTYGVLYEREQQRGHDARRAAAAEIKRVPA